MVNKKLKFISKFKHTLITLKHHTLNVDESKTLTPKVEPVIKAMEEDEGDKLGLQETVNEDDVSFYFVP